ncbi:ribonuclease H-like domain-containing protein [Favolaschia claudopus]|uniref:Ribonuclease H-like domain-containing protein n=1 Tax=Favolaschia claudopus TaxID=2862362 RepID=A0AAV9ZB65_9AGAR
MVSTVMFRLFSSILGDRNAQILRPRRTKKCTPDDLSDVAAVTVVQLGNPSGAKLLPYKLDLPCVVLDSADAADRHLQSIEPDTVVGFDAEFRQEDKKQFLCIVQIATPSTVYIIDLIKIKAEDESILKCGVGISNDGKAFWDTFHINARGLADLGWMAKLAFPMSYRAKVGHVSLQQCVADMLHFNMGKEEQRSDWGQGLPDVETPRGLALITYEGNHKTSDAAIDAQAGLRLYPLLDAAIQVTSQQRKIEIPEDWYTFHCWEGRTVNSSDTDNRVSAEKVGQFKYSKDLTSSSVKISRKTWLASKELQQVLEEKQRSRIFVPHQSAADIMMETGQIYFHGQKAAEKAVLWR